MLSNSLPVDYVMVAQMQKQQQQHAVELGVVNRFHPVARPAGLDSVRVPAAPSIAAYSPALPAMMAPPPPPSAPTPLAMHTPGLSAKL